MKMATSKAISIRDQMQIKLERDGGSSLQELSTKYKLTYNRVQTICNKSVESLLEDAKDELVKKERMKENAAKVEAAMKALETLGISADLRGEGTVRPPIDEVELEEEEDAAE
jgi:hypothetical protein